MTQYCEIVVKSHLDAAWADCFEGLTITHQHSGETRLIGPLPDQDTLHGVLNRLRDLGVQLISVNVLAGAPTSGEESVDERR